jgi:hypothetical protein
MPQYGQDAVEDEVGQRQAGHNVGFEADCPAANVGDHEREL